MHTALYRANALFTAASTALAVMALATAVTDLRLAREPVGVSASVVAVDGIEPARGGDRAWFLLDASIDARPLFHWNTKQAFVWVGASFSSKGAPRSDVMLWSTIATAPADALIAQPGLRIDYPFALTDAGAGLRGTPFNLTVGWQTTPRVGAVRSGRVSLPGGVFPGEYSPPGDAVRGDWE